jgi:hypothetical protein
MPNPLQVGGSNAKALCMPMKMQAGPGEAFQLSGQRQGNAPLQCCLGTAFANSGEAEADRAGTCILLGGIKKRRFREP